MVEKWAVFISGRGSNAQALFDLMSELNVVLCVSSKSSAFGLARARRQGVPVLVLEKKIDWQALDLELKKRGIHKIFLLGFMRLLPESFVKQWEQKIYNVHPSLLPAYPGVEAIEKSFAENSAMGVTVHEVITEMDAGKKVLQFKTLDQNHGKNLGDAQLLISAAEQRLVRTAALRKNVWN